MVSSEIFAHKNFSLYIGLAWLTYYGEQPLYWSISRLGFLFIIYFYNLIFGGSLI